jgi:peptidoglycan/xylan/chitin deacetylase (PgdA/CDA1 family)
MRTILDDLKPGSIIRFHDRLKTGRDIQIENTVKILPAILDSIEKRGYHFVTLSELKSEDESYAFKKSLPEKP